MNLQDFFLADQLTSQVQALRSLEFYICYYGIGDFRQRQRNTCRSNDVFTTFYFIVAVIPYWLRFIQCIRRIIEENDLSHGYNAAKYLLTIVAACLRTAYTLNRGTTWNITAWVFSGVATLYATYWDIVIDWGLLQRGCKNSFLRDKLLVPHKTVYYAAMVSSNILYYFVLFFLHYGLCCFIFLIGLECFVEVSVVANSFGSAIFFLT